MKTKPPKNWWVKISDFGLSKQIVQQLENPSSVKGTSGYMAPELYGFGTDLDASSVDWFAAYMWSVGAMLFFSITRQTAFQNHSELAAYASASGTHPFSALRQASIENLGKDFISSLMSAAPNKRLTVSKARQHSWVNGNTRLMLAISTSEPQRYV